MNTMVRYHLLAVCCLLTFACQAWSQDVQTVIVSESHRGWSIKPFRHGYGVRERKYGISTYDRTSSELKGSRFPIDRVAGTVRIPVFLVDWSDFDPAKHPSNKDNPRVRNPDYQRTSVEKIQADLNCDTGSAGYYKAASGGQLILHFDVYHWISSNKSKYLKDKEPAYYKYVEERKEWVALKKPMAMDVLRAAIVEQGFAPRKYDADHNKVIDGLIIVYEGTAGPLAGKNMSSLGPLYGTMGNFKEILPETDPNFKHTKELDILYRSYINVPEDSLTVLRTMTHELGHLLLGYKDYYLFGGIGEYAMSSRGANFSPAAMEKWIFGKWISPQVVTGGELALDNHHLKVGETYSDKKTYLHQVFVDNDPYHYFLIENRFFDPEKRHFDKQHSSPGSPHPESGLVVFEVNENLAGRKQWKGQSIIRHFPEKKRPTSPDERLLYKRQTFQRGEEFHWKKGVFELHITNLSKLGEVMNYTLSTTSPRDTEASTAPKDVSVSVDADAAATVTWSAAEDSAAVAGYFLDIALDAEFKRPLVEYACKNVRLNTEYVATKLKKDTSYYLRLRAMDVAGNFSCHTATCTFETKP